MAKEAVSGSPTLAAPDEPSVHNSVLIRSHEVKRSAGLHLMAPLIVAAIVAAGVLFYVRSNPAPQVQNLAVGAAPVAPKDWATGHGH